MLALLHLCAWFRRQSPAGHCHEVHIQYVHESDSTGQNISQHLVQRIGRPSRQQLSTEVIHQQGVLHILLRVVSPDGTAHEADIVQVWLAPSLVLLGKTAVFLRTALERGMPFDIGQGNWAHWVSLIKVACDTFGFGQVGDKASANIPAFRHFAECVLDVPQAVVDVSSCELHSLQNIKTSLPDLRGYIGRLYSLSRIMKVASFHADLLNVVEYMADSVVRITAPPPAGQASELRILVGLLFRPEAEHHRRGGEASSVLISDLEALCDAQVYRIEGEEGQPAAFVHYCWDVQSGQPCCADLATCRGKIAASQVNLQLSTAMDTVAMSRFTHLGKCRKRLLMGMASGGFFLTALHTAAGKNISDRTAALEDPVAPLQHATELGAGSADHQDAHRSRCGRLAEWLASLETHFLLPIAEVCESVLDDLQYRFFGHKGSSITVGELVDPVSSPIGKALQTYRALLVAWSPSSTGPWAVLFLSGWRNFDDTRARLAARREALLCACGVFMRFDIKFSALPWALSKLTGQSANDSEKAELRRFLVEGPACCKPLYVQGLVRRFPTETDLASETALAAMRLAEKTRLLTTKLSELGHAEERQALYSKGPGRSFIHHSRRDLIRRSRVVYMAGGGADPAIGVAPKRQQKALCGMGLGPPMGA